MKIRLVGAELLHANRRTDKTKLIVALRNFANASKNTQAKATDISKGKGKVISLQARLWPRGWVEV
jgi:ribosomal protein L16/L10AE